MISLSNRQARQFMLLKHGLLGEYKFIGKSGTLDFIRQAGCIQYDENGVKATKKLKEEAAKCLKRFARFNDCGGVQNPK